MLEQSLKEFIELSKVPLPHLVKQVIIMCGPQGIKYEPLRKLFCEDGLFTQEAFDDSLVWSWGQGIYIQRGVYVAEQYATKISLKHWV